MSLKGGLRTYNVAGEGQVSAHFTRSEVEGPRAGVDPLLPFAIGPMNRRCAPDCGRRRAERDSCTRTGPRRAPDMKPSETLGALSDTERTELLDPILSSQRAEEARIVRATLKFALERRVRKVGSASARFSTRRMAE
jgi:hypothetical protein